MKLKILSIDCPLETEHIECSTFYQSLSFSDYDVVIIDPTKISEAWMDKIPPRKDGSLITYSSLDGGFSAYLIQTMFMRSHETKLLLERAGGIVICLLRNRGIVLDCLSGIPERKHEINVYSWIPPQDFGPGKPRLSPHFSHLRREGKEIGEINKGHPFHQYFAALKDKIFFEAVINDPLLLKFSTSIAKNKVGEAIALEIPFGKGKFIFLPPFVEEDTEKVSGVLINCIRKSLQWTPPLVRPDWLEAYILAGEGDLQKELGKLDDELKTLSIQKETLLKKYEEFESLKGLLYETGKYTLEPSVRKGFRIIGFDVKEPDEYEEDYDLFATDGDIFIIGEVEGSTKIIDVEKYRQLLDYVEEFELKGKKCKGILIGNGFLDTEPSLRGEQFSDHVIKGCERQKYCRLTTYELYKAVSAVLSNPGDEGLKNSIKEKILNCEGEFKFDDIPGEISKNLQGGKGE